MNQRTPALSVTNSSLPVTPEIRYRNKSLPQKLKPKGKASSIVSSAPVSLSTIKQHSQIEETTVEQVRKSQVDEGDVFHDAEGQGKVESSGPREAIRHGTGDSSKTPAVTAEKVPWKNIGIGKLLVF